MDNYVFTYSIIGVGFAGTLDIFNGIGLTIVSYIYFAVKQKEFSPYAIYQHALESRKQRLFRIFGVAEK